MRNWLYFLLPIAALAAAFLFHAPYVAYATYTFLLLVLVANLSSHMWLAGLDCTRVVSHHMLQQGEETTVDLTIANKRGWPIPWIFVEDRHPGDFPRRGDRARLAVLMPGRQIRLQYTLTCPRRGYHRIGPMVMESGDLFGLQRRFRTGASQEYVSVLPTIAYIETFNISSRRPQGPVKLSNKIYEDPTRIASIRQYIQGDPLNRIHWKVSARAGSLHTKTLEASMVSGGTMILDFHAGNYKPEKREERQELAVTTTASIGYLLQVSGEQVGLLTNGFDAALTAEYDIEEHEALSKDDVEDVITHDQIDDRIKPLLVPTIRSTEQAQRIAENLARIVPGRGLDLPQLILAEYRGLPRDASLLVVTPQVTDLLALTLAEMKAAGFIVNVFFINDLAGYNEACQHLAPHYIQVFHITHERDLHTLSPARIGQ